jgi:hypothetical protein
MKDQDILHKIDRLAKSVCKPSRGITDLGERTISFTLFKTRYSKGRTIISVYRCRIVNKKNELELLVNNNYANSEDEERIFCLLLELYKFQEANKHR